MKTVKVFTPVCSVEGCGACAKARGFCDKHYSRWYKWGDPLVTRHSRTSASLPKNPPLDDELYAVWLRYTPPPKPTQCQASGCVNLHFARGLCRRHYDHLMHRLRPARQKTKGSSATHARS
jgi:hypothetical protein